MFIFDEHEVIVEVLDRLDPFFFLNKQRFLPFLQGDKEKAIPKQTHSRKNIQKEQDRPAQHPNIDATGNKGYDKAEHLDPRMDILLDDFIDLIGQLVDQRTGILAKKRGRIFLKNSANATLLQVVTYLVFEPRDRKLLSGIYQRINEQENDRHHDQADKFFRFHVQAEQLSHQIRFSKLKDRKDKDQAEYESEKFSIVFV